MTPSSENREECIVFISTPKGPPELFCRERPTGKPLSQTCVASENGFEARLVFDEAISMPQRAFERRVDRLVTPWGRRSTGFTLTPMRPRPWGDPSQRMGRVHGAWRAPPTTLHPKGQTCQPSGTCGGTKTGYHDTSHTQKKPCTPTLHDTILYNT